MTEVSNKRQEIAKEIRALLMSSPAALTIEELRKDFHQFMDKPIPFRELGYSMLEDMLRDMTDVLYITYKKGMMCLEVVADDTTRHIAKLVSKQKIPNKNKYATMRKGPPPRTQRKMCSTLPHYIRKNISELFKSYHNGLPLTHFHTAYSKRFGSMFSFSRLGFVSLKELLYSIPEIVTLKEYQGGEWRVLPAHCSAPEGNWRSNNNNVENHHQGSTSKGKIEYNDPGAHYGQNNPQINNDQAYNKLLPYRVEDGKTESLQQKAQPGGRGKGRGMKRSACTGDQASVGRTSESSYNSNEPEVKKESDSSFNSNEPQADAEYFNDVTDGLKILQTELRDLLAENQEGIWSSQLPYLYKMKYKKMLNFKDLGYMSVIELCNAFPDYIRIERPSSQDWLLFDARIQPKTTAKPEEKRKRHESQKKADPELKEKIRQVVMSKKDGIPLGDFLEFYKKLTGENLPFEDIGFKSVDRFLLSLTDTLLRFKYKGDGIIMVLPLDETAPQRTDKLIYIPEPEEVVKNPIPDDAILPGACYRHLDLPPLGDYFECYVSNIVSPGLFWFQIRSKQTTVVLEKVMNQLESCYNCAEGNRYKIPDELIVMGLVVAAIFPEDSNWHRCVITKLEVGHMVQVYFVDYGNTCSVHKNNLRLLRSKFLKLAIQAIQGRLANIQPNGPENQPWTLNARNRLLNMCINRALVALGTAEKDRVMSLVLIDTSKDQDVCYNDVLVQENYALFKPDDHTTNLSGPSDAPEIPDYSYVYGLTGSQTPFADTASVTAVSSQETDLSEVKHRFVKQVQLTGDYKFHIINIDGIARVLSEEISALLFDTDVLTGMLQRCRKNFDKIKISIEEQPQLFLELQEFNVIPGSSKCISLYELNSVPMILAVFNKTSEELSNKIKDAIQKFDPEDPYWKGEVEQEAEGDVESEEDLGMDRENIELTIETLQYKRKRILHSLMDITISQSEEVVNELNNIEEQITRLKAAYEKAPKPKPVIKSEQFEDADPQNVNKTTAKKPIKSAAVSPTKITNVVTPMKSTAPPSLPKTASQSNQSGQNPMNPLNMSQQQLLFQQMLMAQMNQQAMLNPLMSQIMLGQVGTMPFLQGQGSEGQTTNSVNTVPTMPFGNMTPGMGNMMQSVGLPNMGNFQAMLNPSQSAQSTDSTGSNQGDLSELPLLPGLLPLLQNWSVGRGSGNINGNSGTQ